MGPLPTNWSLSSQLSLMAQELAVRLGLRDLRRARSSLATWALTRSLNWLLRSFDGSLRHERSLAEASLVDAMDKEDTGDENRDPAESIFSFVW